MPGSRISRPLAHTCTFQHYLASRLADHRVPPSVQPRGRCRVSGRFPSRSTHMTSPPPLWQLKWPPMRRHQSKAKKRHLGQTREPAPHRRSRCSTRPTTSWRTSRLSSPQRGKGCSTRCGMGTPKPGQETVDGEYFTCRITTTTSLPISGGFRVCPVRSPPSVPGFRKSHWTFNHLARAASSTPGASAVKS